MSALKPLVVSLILFACIFVLISPVFSVTLLAEAMDDFDQKRFHAAAELLEQVIKKQPASAQAYYYLGATLEQLKDFDNAKKLYEACFKLNPFSDQGRQAKTALNNLIEKQAALAHPYDEPGVVDTSVRNINQEVNHLQQDKINTAAIESAYQLQRGNFRAMNFGFQANMAYNDYFGRTATEYSNLAQIRAYDALAYAQRESTRALTGGYQAARYARDSGNNLINSFNEPPFRPDEPQLRALGTNLYVRNYSYTDDDDIVPADPPVELKATAGKLSTNSVSGVLHNKS